MSALLLIILNDNTHLQVFFSLKVSVDLFGGILVAGHCLPSDAELLAALPQNLNTVRDVKKVIDGLDSLQLCTGNDDERYFSIQAARKGVFKGSTG